MKVSAFFELYAARPWKKSSLERTETSVRILDQQETLESFDTT